MKTRNSTLLCAALCFVLPEVGLSQQATAPSGPDPSQLRALTGSGVSTRNPDVARALAAAKARLEFCKQILDEDSMVVAKLKSSIRDGTGLPSSAGLQPLVSELQLQRETLQQEEAAAKGRRAGLEATLSEWTIRAKSRVVDDPLVKELNIVVDKEERNVERMKALHDTASVSQSAYDDAIAQLALAKAKVATAQQRSASTANEATDVWNRELMNLNIAAQERAARLQYINARLKTLERVLDQLDALESAVAELRAAEQNVRGARQRVEEDQILLPN